MDALSTFGLFAVGLGIVAMNADAAREVWQAARDEHRTAEPYAWFVRRVLQSS
jgi:hypothetical protein